MVTKSLKTIEDWKKIIHEVALKFKNKELKQIEGSIVDETDINKRCFNGGLLCTLGYDMTRFQGQDPKDDPLEFGWTQYRKLKCVNSFQRLIGKQYIKCSYSKKHREYDQEEFELIEDYIGHLNDVHGLKNIKLEQQFLKDLENALK